MVCAYLFSLFNLYFVSFWQRSPTKAILYHRSNTHLYITNSHVHWDFNFPHSLLLNIMVDANRVLIVYSIQNYTNQSQKMLLVTTHTSHITSLKYHPLETIVLKPPSNGIFMSEWFCISHQQQDGEYEARTISLSRHVLLLRPSHDLMITAKTFD